MITSLPSGYVWARQESPSKTEVEQAIEWGKEYHQLLDRFDENLSSSANERFILDEFWLLPQSVVYENQEKHKTTQHLRPIGWWDVVVDFRDAESENPLTENLLFQNLAPSLQSTQLNGSALFSLSTQRYGVIHEFRIPIIAAATLGPYLVYIRKNSFDDTTQTQTVSFIDLRTHMGLLGNETLPVYEIPLSSPEAITTLSATSDHLVVGQDAKIHQGQLDDLSTLWTTTFNLTANLVDPKTVASTIPLVDTFFDYLKRRKELHAPLNTPSSDATQEWAQVLESQLEQQLATSLARRKAIKSIDKSKMELVDTVTEQLKDEITVLKEEASHLVNTYHQTLLQSQHLEKALRSTQSNLRSGRKLTGHLHRLKTHLISPRPYASKKIRSALAAVVAAARVGLGEKPARVIDQMSRRPFVTSAMLAAASIAVVHPEIYGPLMSEGLNAGRTLLGALWASISGIGETAWKAATTTFSVLTDPIDTLNKAYVAEGNWYRTIIGLSVFSGAMAIILGGYHVINAPLRAFLDRRKAGEDWKGLADRQNQLQQSYLGALAKAEDDKRKRNSEKSAEFTDEDHLYVKSILENKKQELKPSKGLWNKVTGHREVDIVMGAAIDPAQTEMEMARKIGELNDLHTEIKESTVANEVAEKDPNQLKGFWGGFKHLIFSYATYSRTILDYTKIWNFYSGLRYCSFGWSHVKVCGVEIPFIKFKPLTLVTRILYPDFFNVTVNKKSGQTVLPTTLNGGLVPIHKKVGQWFARRLQPLIMYSSPEMARRQISLYESFEDKIIDVEELVVEQAMKQSLSALTQFIDKDSDLQKLYSSDGIKSITSQQIRELNFKNKTFVRTYFEAIYERAMKKLLIQKVAQQDVVALQESVTNQAHALAPQYRELHEKLEQMSAQAERGEVAETDFEDLKNLIVAQHFSDSSEVDFSVTEDDVKAAIA